MERYVTYPTLVLHLRRRVFAVVHNPALSVWDRLVELTEEERLEKDPAKRREYSVGPGCAYPASTAEELAVMSEVHRSNVMPITGSKERGILDAHNERMSLACTHKYVPADTPHEEIAAAHAIIDLARLGAIHKVKRCDVCKIWFFASPITRRCGNTPAECARERGKQNPEYGVTQELKAQRRKERAERDRLLSELAGLRKAAKGILTEEECDRVDAIESSIGKLTASIDDSLKRANENKAWARHRG
jgi:hypothetical protein